MADEKKPREQSPIETFLYDAVKYGLWPSFKDCIYGFVTDIIDAIFDGKHVTTPSRGRISSSKGPNRTPYNQYFDERKGNKGDKTSINGGTGYVDYKNIIFRYSDFGYDHDAAYREAKMVLNSLISYYAKRNEGGIVTVANLFEAAHLKGNGMTDCNFGWKNLEGACVRKVEGGYKLDLPEAYPIEDFR